MKQGYTHISVVLDRSGSMSIIANDVRVGMTNFIKEQKNYSDECTFSLYQFDNKFQTDYSFVNMQDVSDKINFEPRAWTALYDAIGRAIIETGEQLSELEEDQRPQKVLFVIFTDGMENASREFTFYQVKKMITEQTEKYNWEFVYLGANQDAFQVGTGLGFNGSNSVSYDVNKISDVLNTISSKVSLYRSAVSSNAYADMNMAFDDNERSKFMGKTQ